MTWIKIFWCLHKKKPMNKLNMTNSDIPHITFRIIFIQFIMKHNFYQTHFMLHMLHTLPIYNNTFQNAPIWNFCEYLLLYIYIYIYSFYFFTKSVKYKNLLWMDFNLLNTSAYLFNTWRATKTSQGVVIIWNNIR